MLLLQSRSLRYWVSMPFSHLVHLPRKKCLAGIDQQLHSALSSSTVAPADALTPLIYPHLWAHLSSLLPGSRRFLFSLFLLPLPSSFVLSSVSLFFKPQVSLFPSFNLQPSPLTQPSQWPPPVSSLPAWLPRWPSRPLALLCELPSLPPASEPSLVSCRCREKFSSSSIELPRTASRRQLQWDQFAHKSIKALPALSRPSSASSS